MASAQYSILESARAFLSNNRSSLRDLSILNLSGGSNLLLSEVQTIVSLRHLALDGWIDPSGSRLRQIFQDCKNLQSLSLAMNALSLDETTFGELAEAPFPITSIKRLVLDRSTISMDLLTNLARCMPHLKYLSLANTYGFSHSTSHDDSSSWSDSDEEASGDSDLDVNDIFGNYMDDYSDRSPPPSVANTYTGEGSPVTSFIGEDVVLDPAPFPPTDDVDVVSNASHESPDVAFTPASGLADTAEPLGAWSYDEENKLRKLHQLCPDIVSFDFTGCKSDGVDDAMLTTICQLWGTNGLQALKFGGVCQFWDSTCCTIAQYCSRTLTVLELSSRHHTPAQFAFVQLDPMAQVLLESCRALEVLRIDSYPIRAGDIGYEPWQCSNLKELGIWIAELKTLILTAEDCLLPSTPGSDLDLWADLAVLETLSVEYLGPFALDKVVVDWVAQSWTGVKAIFGFFFCRQAPSAKMNDWREVLDTTEEALADVPADIDCARNVTLVGFQLMAPHVGRQAYHYTFENFLGCCDLEMVPTLDLPQGFGLSKHNVCKKQA
ncbi:hypothetical protein BG006_001799 [Podila minutissima]|uniref:Uncharacterized protein n=1 Tax=Podila minutissima TaxID=64525 RepID=A0A9P5SCF2_9FUNG|nr:hypothetical protein BG006_001799 [Podila minutissima]